MNAAIYLALTMVARFGIALAIRNGSATAARHIPTRNTGFFFK